MPESNKLIGKEDEIRELFDSGLSDGRIAEKLKVTRQGIQKFRKKHKIMRTQKNKFFNGLNYKLAGKDREIARLNKEGLSDGEIGKQLGVRPSAILYVRDRLGLPAIKQYNHGENKDPDFGFDAYNPKELMKTDFGQVLIGTMLGDGCIPKKINLLQIAHQNNQRNYLEYKKERLDIIDATFSKRETKTGYGYSLQSSYRFKVCPFFKHLRKIFYPEGKKIIPFEYLELLDLRGLMIWIYDDGTIRYVQRNYDDCNISIATMSFTKKENMKACEILKKNFGLMTSSETNRDELIGLTKRNEIFFKKKDTIKLCKMALQYLPEGLDSKTEKIKKIALL